MGNNVVGASVGKRLASIIGLAVGISVMDVVGDCVVVVVGDISEGKGLGSDVVTNELFIVLLTNTASCVVILV